MAATFNQCVSKSNKSESSSSGSGVSISNDEEKEDSIPKTQSVFQEAGANEVTGAATSVAVKDFEQVYETYQALTGISSLNDGNIRGAYTAIAGQLANDNDVKKLSVSTNIAHIKLAGVFCDRMFSDSQYYTGLVSFNLGSRANDVLVGRTSNQIELADALMNKFWGTGTQDQEEYQQNLDVLLELIEDLLVEENVTNSQSSRRVARGVCTSLLVTPRVLFL